MSGARTGWEGSDLEPLPAHAREDVLRLPRAWLLGQEWRPSPPLAEGLLAAHLERQGLGGALGALVLAGRGPDGILGELGRSHYLSNTLHHERGRRLCQRVKAAAAAAGVPICLVKGPTLVESAYRDEGVRQYSDIDLLVESWPAAEALLTRLLGGPALPAGSVADRLRDPGRIHLDVDEQELEIVVLASRAGDPMFDLVDAHRARFFGESAVGGDLPMPEPSAHLAFLMQHLARHFCSRLIWFLDLVALVRTQGPAVDFEWVARQAVALQMTNLFSAIAAFCRGRLDPGFPALPRGPAGFNERAQAAMVQPSHILRGDFQVFDRGRRRKVARYMLSGIKYFVITDPRLLPSARPSPAATWTAARLLNGVGLPAVGWPCRALARVLELLLVAVSVPMRLLFRFVSSGAGEAAPAAVAP